MPILKNARRELFAQEVAKGTTITKSHELAGYKPDDGNASKLAANQEIKARIQELTAAGAERAAVAIGVTKEMITAELKKLGFSNMLDYVTIGSDGLPFVDMSKVDRDKGAAIQEVVVETITRSEVNEAGEREAVPSRKVRFKLADKRAALVDMGRHLGMNVDKVEQIVSIAADSVNADELKAQILAEMAELGLVPSLAALPAVPEAGVANKANGKTKH